MNPHEQALREGMRLATKELKDKGAASITRSRLAALIGLGHQLGQAYSVFKDAAATDATEWIVEAIDEAGQGIRHDEYITMLQNIIEVCQSHLLAVREDQKREQGKDAADAAVTKRRRKRKRVQARVPFDGKDWDWKPERKRLK